MKLQELAVVPQTKQAAKVLESHFGNRVDFDTMSRTQAQSMLKRVRALVAEHRRTPEFHSSEKNPAYLKLVVMEQALSAVAGAPQVDPAKQAGLQAAQVQQQKRQIQDSIRAKQAEIVELQKQLNNPTLSTMPAMETRKNLRQRLKESEVQQAQVVLASQDMVDEVQKMLERVTAMQFKDLPALVDSIKNEVGVDQAMQFNTDSVAALSGLTQNLQGTKQQLEAALGVVTGNAPQVPGAELGADTGLDAAAELPPEELPLDGEEELDIEIDDEKDSNDLASSLGRGRR